MLTEKFIGLLDYIRKEERMRTNDISINIKNLGNKGKLNLTEKIKKNMREKLAENKCKCFIYIYKANVVLIFEKIDKIYKYLTRCIRQKR